MSHRIQTIPFIEKHRHNAAVALRDEDRNITYKQLCCLVEEQAKEWQRVLPSVRPIAILKLSNSIESVVNYLTALSLDIVSLLIAHDVPEVTVEHYIEQLSPHLLISEEHITPRHDNEIPLSPELAILLSTSGSTGAGKCVALSSTNLEANCASILNYLPIESSDITLATLPIHYSYGLSVLNTHLSAGACLYFTPLSVFDKGFWQLMKALPVASLAGVPSFYEMLATLRFTRMDFPSLRYMTQAGGRLSYELVKAFAEYCTVQNKQFFVMYGQTEASARVAFLAPEKAAAKPDAIGQAIPGGELKLKKLRHSVNGEGELLYRGKNVMLGYVSTSSDLKKFKLLNWLPTGDIATCDADGDYRIVGRLKRIIKIAGERLSLDALEILLTELGVTAKCTGVDDLLGVFTLNSESQSAVVDTCVNSLGIAPRNLQVHVIEDWPLLQNSKVDYADLKARINKE